MRSLLAPGFALFGLLGGCGGGGDRPDARTGDPNVLAGAFKVELVAPVPANGSTPARPGYTAVLGTVYDGAQPSPITFVPTMTDGPCTLLVPDVPFCTTPCGGTAVCVADDTCAPYATKHSVGTVQVSGIATTTGATSFEMEPIVENYQPPAGIELAYPPFAAGAPVQMTATGSDFTAGFRLDATGIDELVLGADTFALAGGAALDLAWTPGAGGANTAAIEVKLDISHHGGTKGMITCAWQDSGALTITAQLVDALLALGAAGFPTIIVSRRVTGSTVMEAGRVALVITSEVERPVTVPGVQSCNDDTDCTPPETCQEDLTCG
jgi:hypothetical protein